MLEGYRVLDLGQYVADLLGYQPERIEELYRQGTVHTADR